MLLYSSVHPYTVCKNCVRAFDFEGNWGLKNQDPTKRVVIITEGEEGWGQIEAECPNCFSREIYDFGEYVWSSRDDSKEKEAMEAENVALRRKWLALQRQNIELQAHLEKSRGQVKQLQKDNRRLADIAYSRLPKEERRDLK